MYTCLGIWNLGYSIYASKNQTRWTKGKKCMCKSNLNYSVPNLRLNRFWFSNNIHMVLIILTSNLCLSLCSFLFSLCVSFCLSLGLFLFTNKLRLQFLLFSCRFVRLCSLKSLALIFSWMSSLVSNPPSSSQMHASCSFFFFNDCLFFGWKHNYMCTSCINRNAILFSFSWLEKSNSQQEFQHQQQVENKMGHSLVVIFLISSVSVYPSPVLHLLAKFLLQQMLELYFPY